MSELTMAVRDVNETRREIVGRAAPYDETTFLVGGAGGERLMRGCFSKTISERGRRIPLCVGHNHREAAVGLATSWDDGPDGLAGVFQIRADEDGDRVLRHAADGYLSALSVGFEPTKSRRARDGATEILEAKLHEVSLVSVGAYAGAGVTEVRTADEIRADLERQLAPFRNPPPIDLSPLPPFGLT
jgi:HK97 family phage prohead protease